MALIARLSLIFHLLIFVDIISPSSIAGAENGPNNKNISLGAVLDYSSIEGKTMGVAVEDFNAQAGTRRLVLHLKDSTGDLVQAAQAARNLIRKNHVRAIVGLRTAQEVTAAADVGNRSSVPVLSLTNEIPRWWFWKWRFLVESGRSQQAQMEAIGAVLLSWKWRRVNIIYEDDAGLDSSITSTLPYLITALRDVDVDVSNLLALPPLTQHYALSEKLDSLRNRQCRVFIVHTSVKLAVSVFREAKDMGLMESGAQSVWIATTNTMDYINTLDAASIFSMEGLVGVRSYFPRGTKKLKHFHSRFRSICRRRSSNCTRKPYVEPGILALQAYDAVWALALASDKTRPDQMEGRALLDDILDSSFTGLSGEFKFVNGSLEPARIFELINVVGKSYREIGYWTKGFGFSKFVDKNGNYSNSTSLLGQIYWPGGPWSIPKGWAIPTGGSKLKIGVPLDNAHKEFVNASYDVRWGKWNVTGFSVRVFNATLKRLPYHLDYEFYAFNGTYDSLVQRVYSKEVDAVVADTAIVANRSQYVEFAQPYSDSNLQILIYVRPERLGKAWLILRPFTPTMWIATIIVNIFCGFTVYIIERTHHPDLLKGGVLNQTIVILMMSFITLFSQQGRKLHSNLSRITMVLWLVVALVVTQTYTANLASLLTIDKLNQADVTVESLIRDGVKVGCDRNSFVVKHLEGLGFKSSNIKTYYEEDYARALATGEVGAAFLESPYAKVFLSRNCKGFTTAKQTVQVGGFGFVFEKSSPYLPDISEAVLSAAESGAIRDLESSMLSSYQCSSSGTDNSDQQRIGTDSFLGLYAVTVVTSAVSLLVFSFPLACGNTSSYVPDEKKKGNEHGTEYE